MEKALKSICGLRLDKKNHCVLGLSLGPNILSAFYFVKQKQKTI